MENTEYAASVVITTYNRKDELRGALQSALTQTISIEIIVMDDASTDGTSEMVRSEFPSVRLVRSDHNLGLIEQRNRAAELATAPYIISIDDDARFTTTDTVQQTLQAFDRQSIGAVAMPYVDVLKSPDVKQTAPSNGVWVVSTYRGTAHALRKDIFLRLGGYSAWLYRQGEEEDYCMRLIDAGYRVRLGSAPPIHHYESPNRSMKQICYYAARNGTLIAWHNAPLLIVGINIFANNIRMVSSGAANGQCFAAIRGVTAAYWWMLSRRRIRHPVSWTAYWRFRRLRKGGPQLVDDCSD